VPRDYTMKLPKQMRQLARKSALSYKAKEGNIRVVEDFSLEAPKTKEVIAILKGFGIDRKKVLLIMTANDPVVVKSGRNIEKINVIEAAKASTYEILNTQMLLIQRSAIEILEKTFKQ